MRILTLVIMLLGLFVFLTKYIPKSSPRPLETKQEIAEKIRQTAKEINDNCHTKDATCFETSVREKLLDIYPTYQILDAIYDYDTHFSCHAFTHFIGRALYKKTGNIPDSYSQINFTCHGGTYHGVIEAYLDENSSKIANLDIEQICKDSKNKTDKNPQAVTNECLHGFGHAFMFITDNELSTSLSYCDKLRIELREICYSGTFMENSTSSTNRDHPTRWLKADDKFFPCTILGERYLNQCYFYQANYLIMSSNHDFQKVYNDCNTLSGTHYNYCAMGIGAILASVSSETSIENAASVCNLGKGRARTICVEGAIPSLMQRYGGEVEKLIKFCSASPADLIEACFAKLGITSKMWHTPQQVELICKQTESFYDFCIGKKTVKLYFD